MLITHKFIAYQVLNKDNILLVYSATVFKCHHCQTVHGVIVREDYVQFSDGATSDTLASQCSSVWIPVPQPHISHPVMARVTIDLLLS